MYLNIPIGSSTSAYRLFCLHASLEEIVFQSCASSQYYKKEHFYLFSYCPVYSICSTVFVKKKKIIVAGPTYIYTAD
jgi:hypothetical protein